MDYDAFGNERHIVDQDASLDNNPFRYDGEYFDKETGTVYLRARNYDPEIGRFTTEDSYLGDITDPLRTELTNGLKNTNRIYTGSWIP